MSESSMFPGVWMELGFSRKQWASLPITTRVRWTNETNWNRKQPSEELLKLVRETVGTK